MTLGLARRDDLAALNLLAHEAVSGETSAAVEEDVLREKSHQQRILQERILQARP